VAASALGVPADTARAVDLALPAAFAGRWQGCLAFALAADAGGDRIGVERPPYSAGMCPEAALDRCQARAVLFALGAVADRDTGRPAVWGDPHPPHAAATRRRALVPIGADRCRGTDGTNAAVARDWCGWCRRPRRAAPTAPIAPAVGALLATDRLPPGVRDRPALLLAGPRIPRHTTLFERGEELLCLIGREGQLLGQIGTQHPLGGRC
jgi:hypothetical protein